MAQKTSSPQKSNEVATPATAMTKGEREDLQRLVRQREKVLKSAAKQRSAELLADFENQMGSEYAFDDDAIWEEAKKAADREVRKAQKVVAARCRELGIPERFAPGLKLIWRHRGYDNLIDERKRELRRMAEAQVEAIEAAAIVKIELSCLQAQQDIATAGLTTDAAKHFLERLPSIDSLMPALSYSEMAGEADPPIVEQLLSPNALRQQRFRDRQRALRNADVTPPAIGEAKNED